MVDWVHIDGAVVREAREAKGISREKLAPRIHVAAKTLERYEKEGRFPRPTLLRLADLLDIEIEEPARKRLSLSTRPEELEALAERMDGFEERLDRILVLLEGAQEG